jgi:hypothetical protein
VGFGFDPLFTYYRWNNSRRNPNWLASTRQHFELASKNENLRPPRTFAAQQQLLRSGAGGKQGNNLDMASTLKQVAADPGQSNFKFHNVSQADRLAMADKGKQLQQVSTQRLEIEKKNLLTDKGAGSNNAGDAGKGLGGAGSKFGDSGLKLGGGTDSGKGSSTSNRLKLPTAAASNLTAQAGAGSQGNVFSGNRGRMSAAQGDTSSNGSSADSGTKSRVDRSALTPGGGNNPIYSGGKNGSGNSAAAGSGLSGSGSSGGGSNPIFSGRGAAGLGSGGLNSGGGLGSGSGAASASGASGNSGLGGAGGGSSSMRSQSRVFNNNPGSASGGSQSGSSGPSGPNGNQGGNSSGGGSSGRGSGGGGQQQKNKDDSKNKSSDITPPRTNMALNPPSTVPLDTEGMLKTDRRARTDGMNSGMVQINRDWKSAQNMDLGLNDNDDDSDQPNTNRRNAAKSGGNGSGNPKRAAGNRNSANAGPTVAPGQSGYSGKYNQTGVSNNSLPTPGSNGDNFNPGDLRAFNPQPQAQLTPYTAHYDYQMLMQRGRSLSPAAANNAGSAVANMDDSGPTNRTKDPIVSYGAQSGRSRSASAIPSGPTGPYFGQFGPSGGTGPAAPSLNGSGQALSGISGPMSSGIYAPQTSGIGAQMTSGISAPMVSGASGRMASGISAPMSSGISAPMTSGVSGLNNSNGPRSSGSYIPPDQYQH